MAARRGKSQARRNGGNGTPGWVWLIAGAAIVAVVFLAAPGLFKKNGDFLRAGPRPNPDAQPAPISDADADSPADLPKPVASGASDSKPDAGKDQTQFDFYTLLPGKEVKMTDAEIAATERAEDAARARAALEGKPVPPKPVTSSDESEQAEQPKPIAETAPLTQPKPIVETPTAPTVVATTSPAAKPPVTSTATAPPDNARYILQAGSFGASGDAEAIKAKLAMLGLSARVESAQISGRTVYRVRMGPYGTASELADAKRKLDSNGLNAIAIKAQ